MTEKIVMKEYPKVVVGTLIVDNDGNVLIVKSYKWKDKYSIPGGHVEFGESIEDAVKREVKEEVGLNIGLEKILFVLEAINSKEYHKKGKHFIFLECVCRHKSGQIRLDNREMQDAMWINPRKALNLKLTSHTRKFILEYLKRRQ